MQVEVIRCPKKVDIIQVYFCEATDSMQYRPPNANLDSACRYDLYVADSSALEMLLRLFIDNLALDFAQQVRVWDALSIMESSVSNTAPC